jgi:molybdenum cofactor synthesis domain-containing protein
LKFAVITVSDKCFLGQREDMSGPVVRGMLEEAGFEFGHSAVVPDERGMIARELLASVERDLALVVTTGGTGLSPRDLTPEATLDVCERLTPGLPEAMRAESLKITDRAILSRQVAGIRGRTWIINLPGSPKAARENLAAVLPALRHGLEMLRLPQADH